MRPARWGRCLRSGPISPHLTGSWWWPTAERRFGPLACWSWPTVWRSCVPRVQHPEATVSRRLRHECQGDDVIAVAQGHKAAPDWKGVGIVLALLTSHWSACRDLVDDPGDRIIWTSSLDGRSHGQAGVPRWQGG